MSYSKPAVGPGDMVGLWAYEDNRCYVTQVLAAEDSECPDPCNGYQANCHYIRAENPSTEDWYEDYYNGVVEPVETEREAVVRVRYLAFKEGCGENSFDQMTLSAFEQLADESDASEP